MPHIQEDRGAASIASSLASTEQAWVDVSAPTPSEAADELLASESIAERLAICESLDEVDTVMGWNSAGFEGGYHGSEGNVGNENKVTIPLRVPKQESQEEENDHNATVASGLESEWSVLEK